MCEPFTTNPVPSVDLHNPTIAGAASVPLTNPSAQVPPEQPAMAGANPSGPSNSVVPPVESVSQAQVPTVPPVNAEGVGQQKPASESSQAVKPASESSQNGGKTSSESSEIGGRQDEGDTPEPAPKVIHIFNKISTLYLHIKVKDCLVKQLFSCSGTF